MENKAKAGYTEEVGAPAVVHTADAPDQFPTRERSAALAPSDSTRFLAPRAWRSIEACAYWDAPAVGGCYAIYLDGKLSYIGQSVNLRSRLSSYRIRPTYGTGYFTPWGQVADVAVKVKIGHRYGDWAMRELRLIRRLQPSMNCAGSTRRRRTVA